MTTQTTQKPIGPWKYRSVPKRYQNGSNTYRIYISRPEDDLDLEVGEAYGAEANAKLMAAAPELLEALIAALPYVEMAEHDESYKKGSVAKMVKRMRDAISKAEGL